MRVASLRRLTAPIAYVLVASQDPEERRILQRVLKRMMSRQVAAAFDTWMHNVHHRINERHGVVEQPRDHTLDTMTTTGMCIDCGSGHASIMWYNTPTALSEGLAQVQQMRRQVQCQPKIRVSLPPGR